MKTPLWFPQSFFAHTLWLVLIVVIFNPFIRGDKARGGKGTGLGLAIVKRIAAQHGGSVELRNRDGGGLEARVCLPLGLLLPRGAA